MNNLIGGIGQTVKAGFENCFRARTKRVETEQPRVVQAQTAKVDAVSQTRLADHMTFVPSDRAVGFFYSAATPRVEAEALLAKNPQLESITYGSGADEVVRRTVKQVAQLPVHAIDGGAVDTDKLYNNSSDDNDSAIADSEADTDIEAHYRSEGEEPVEEFVDIHSDSSSDTSSSDSDLEVYEDAVEATKEPEKAARKPRKPRRKEVDTIGPILQKSLVNGMKLRFRNTPVVFDPTLKGRYFIPVHKLPLNAK